jgi:PDZ domain-containing protein/aspartyl protease
MLTRAAVGAALAALIATQPSAAFRQDGRAPVTIPFELAIRHVIVKVTVNKSRPLSFVLDTGASAAIVRTVTANALGLPLEGSVNARGVGAGVQAGQRVKDTRWSLVGVDGFSQPLAMALPLPMLPTGLGRDVDGIIGSEFIRQFVVELDYQASTITLHDRKTFTYRGTGQTLPLEFTGNGHPVVNASVTPLGGKPINDRFLFDIGSGGALVLHSPFVAAHNLPGSDGKTVRAIGAGGAGGQSVGRVGRVASLQLGPFTIKNPVTMFSADTAGSFADKSLAGNIGAQIARRFRMFFDYGRARIILEPSGTFDEPFDRAQSGMAVRAEGADYRTFRVREVLEDSPATEAGIQEGDVITAIDGVAAESLTLTAISEMLEQPATRVLMIRRGDQVMRVTSTPKQLI